ncbi:hypothetical protein LXA43DRAFT_1021054 [Ganoderma leucocontextum]|nr:hypothetical protein LXA43DRAFT_1021054 [Ganoderma leucocontextum]
MDDTLLPIDVCKNIIDHCEFRQDFEQSPEVNYETLLACALVCSAWFPRSRRNLLRDVRLHNFDHVDLLWRLFKEHPRLVDLVTAVHITPFAYVPFARFPLSRPLRHCRHLTINPVNWSSIYPPGYCRSISGFRELTELVLGVSGLSAPEIFHIVWSLPLSPRLERFGGKLSERPMAQGKPERCRELRRLVLDSSMAANLLCTANFPPPGAFGSSVTDLTMPAGILMSQSFRERVGDFSKLHSLDITVSQPTSTFAQSYERTLPQVGNVWGASAGGMSYNSIVTEPTSPAALSDPLFTMGGTSSPVFETEPAYTAVNAGGHATNEVTLAGGDGHTNGSEHDSNAAGMFQLGDLQDENWGSLLGLLDPNYWKDMMMPWYDVDVTAPVFQILPHIQSGLHFRELRMSLHPNTTNGVYPIYDLTRTDFLHTLCGATMQQAMKQFPSIQAFVVSICENGGKYDTQWWTEQILNRLPVLRGVLQIDLDDMLLPASERRSLWIPHDSSNHTPSGVRRCESPVRCTRGERDEGVSVECGE